MYDMYGLTSLAGYEDYSVATKRHSIDRVASLSSLAGYKDL